MKITQMLMVLCLLMMVALPSVIAQEELTLSQFDTRCEKPSEIYVQDYGCVEPKYSFNTRVVGSQDADKIGAVTASSIGSDIDPIRVNNPWAAAGQPVIVQFTLENIGDEYQYPFNQIPLLPDSYVLVLGVDKDIGVRTPEGKFIDVWAYMTWWEKFGFVMKTSFGSAKESISKSLEGRQCGFVDVKAYMPERVKEYVNDRAGKDIAVNMWSCLKIVDMPFFARELKSYCQNGIDEQCLADINQDFAGQVTDTVMVFLTSTEKSGLSKGQCERPYQTGGFWNKVGLVAANKQNVVFCSIGDRGLQPGEQVTFDFVSLVPRDAPVIPPKEIENVIGLQQGYTQSVACANDKFATSCHSIYAAVYPAATDNVISWLKGQIESQLSVAGCTLSGIFNPGSYTQCSATRGATIDAVGQPLWEGAGIFYIVGPALRGSITLLLVAVYVGSAMVGFGVGRP